MASPNTVAFEGDFAHTYLYTRGIRLHVAQSGEPSGELVILLHDGFGAWFDFAHVIAPLAAQGFHVAALDLRGYGLSDKPPLGSDFSVRTLASDLAGVIPALGHESAHLVGADIGGAIGWVLATTHPHLVTSLTSISAAHPHDLRRAMRARPWDYLVLLVRQMMLRLSAPLPSHQRLLHWLAARHERLNVTPENAPSERVQSHLAQRHAGIRVDAAAGAMSRIAGLIVSYVPGSRARGQVRCPVLLLHPPQSLWPRMLRIMRTRVAEPALLAHDHIAGTKNLPHVERPEEFTQRVSDFVRSLPCPPAGSAQ
ncbi:alpha/beta fold hydrolase [Corynebacterium tapiri]|uniref:Alpha/beta hydrolase n=1 Tax=Corynebacterium tapiri TaxID=1448266 RepID=A0A5C4U303_9CORY|nr:alpha/beta hydrolase [Corynebacterium tapiri]TNL97354.1 alpha/beta hydrolase [Corynebacterium tapiri]